MENNFKNKIAVITGGSTGIGYATAKELKAKGAMVIITGRRKELLEKAVADLSVESIVSDQANLADIDHLTTTIKQTHGSVDILFINAGIMGASLPIEDNTEAYFDEVMNINFKGAYFTLNKFIPLLKEGASVVFLSSIAATTATRNLSAYTASKAALNAIAKIAAVELASRKIRVNIVSPGPTITDIFNRPGVDPEHVKFMAEYILTKLPVGRFAEAAEIAKAVVYLCEDTSTFITGTELIIDGGYAINN